MIRSAPVHMAAAFLLMGAWAFYANGAHPMPRPLIAGLVQGCLSAVITLFLKRMIEAMARRLDGTKALILPVLAAMAVSVILLGTIHSLAGTPEVLRTMTVPVSVTTLYAAAYNFSLWRQHA